jgi:hypothetical protein
VLVSAVSTLINETGVYQATRWERTDVAEQLALLVLVCVHVCACLCVRSCVYAAVSVVTLTLRERTDVTDQLALLVRVLVEFFACEGVLRAQAVSWAGRVQGVMVTLAWSTARYRNGSGGEFQCRAYATSGRISRLGSHIWSHVHWC